ncbi:MUC5B protein, partial [Polypterus senegalus]
MSLPNFSLLPTREVGKLVMSESTGEIFEICNCTTVKCLENNTLQYIPYNCTPPEKFTCASGRPSNTVMDEKFCCKLEVCDCYCTGFGDPHYITFDGQYYSHQGNCTYLLVEEIRPNYDNFKIYIDNVHCDIRDRVSCPRSIIVSFESQVIELKNMETNGRVKLKVFVNSKEEHLPFKRYGMKVYSSGLNLILEIPEAEIEVTFNGVAFTIKLPYQKFGNNTQGQCGTCNNNRADDCLLPGGQLVDSCEVMADYWLVENPNKSHCTPPTLLPTVPPSKPTLKTSEVPCTANSLCQIIKNRSTDVSNMTTEGCFCPDGTTLFSPNSDICVKKCGCLDPNDIPRKFGEKFEYNCQDCICDEDTKTVKCVDHSCPVIPEPNCNDPGFVLSNETSVDDPCCTELICKPMDVCVFNSVEYQVGVPVPLDKCQTCVCSQEIDPKEKLHIINCVPVKCDETCEPGTIQTAPDGCCKTSVSPAHNGRVCSTWGNYHFKTFDGDVFQLLTQCNYILASHCKSIYEDFNIQVRRSVVDGIPVISKITMKLDGTVVQFSKSGVLINGQENPLPYSSSGVFVEKSNSYIKVTAKLGLMAMWNEEDALLLEIEEKYANQTCGLCGDFNGVQIYDEFIKNGVQINSDDFGSFWKMDDPMETCIDSTPQTEQQCPDQICSNSSFAILGDIMKCGLTDTETCLKKIILSIGNNNNVIVIKSSGSVFLNDILAQLPLSTADVTIFKPSTFYLIIQTSFGLQLKIQLIPIMQVYIKLDQSYKQQTCGLCGNFNNKQEDDFTTMSGVEEGSVSSFSNTWKTMAGCPQVPNFYDNPCSLSVENERYAKYWCSFLTNSVGPFAECHSVINPAPYKANCMYDTCNNEKSEESMCAAISSYVQACAAIGIELIGWRTTICTKYSTNCPRTMVYRYKMTSCGHTCRSLSDQDVTCNVPFEPVDGCGCEEGTYMDEDGKCVSADSCPCYYKGTVVPAQEVISDEGATCIAQNASLAVFAQKVWSQMEMVTTNELKLSEGHVEVIQINTGTEVPYKIRIMGIYLVIEANNGMILMWDRKTSMFIKLSPEFKGDVCGLCGNYDGDANNDFTTRSLSVVVDALEFGNSWKVSPSCPDAKYAKDPCLSNPYRQSWAQKQCSIIKSVVFTDCHYQVDPIPYYDACVQDSCACDSGGDCECFCTAVASYAKACNEAEVCVAWRSPEICPLFCDYYNPPGDCEWHYKPCGAHCMKTCRNPSGMCSEHIKGLEGCYPQCPPEEPIFDEDSMKCVPSEDCGCFDDEGHHYKNGDLVPSNNNCQECLPVYLLAGYLCSTYLNLAKCYCIYNGNKYPYGATIYNTTDGLGSCITANCGLNGTIHREIYACTTTPTTTPTTTTASSTTVFAFSTLPTKTGEIVYNKTDGDGWCYIAYCGKSCQIEKNVTECHLTSVTTMPSTATSAIKTTHTASLSTRPLVVESTVVPTSKPFSTHEKTTTAPPDCNELNPPRKYGESWNIDKCTTATCEGGNNIILQPAKCDTVKPMTCDNGRQPIKVYDASGCCFHYECECTCYGWGDPHYVTFDGTVYDYQGNCTYVLVKEITPKYNNFSVLIDNYFCSAQQGLSCPRALTIYYRSNEIILTVQTIKQQTKNLILFNQKQVIPAFEKDGIKITSTGIEMVVEIPEISAHISFKGMMFSVFLPYSLFQNNTEGHCVIKCPSTKVYKACGPVVEPTCNYRYNEKHITKDTDETMAFKEGCFCPDDKTLFNSFSDVCVSSCECDLSLCPKPTDNCELGFKPVFRTSPDECCPIYSCEPKGVCVYNNTEYQPGVPVIMENCFDCTCNSTMNPDTKLNIIDCQPIYCDTNCQIGFIYQEVPGQCCGQCVQKDCIILLPDGTAHIIQVDQYWSPANDTCIRYECLKIEDQYVTMESRTTCPEFHVEDCVPLTSVIDGRLFIQANTPTPPGGALPTVWRGPECQQEIMDVGVFLYSPAGYHEGR